MRTAWRRHGSAPVCERLRQEVCRKIFRCICDGYSTGSKRCRRRRASGCRPVGAEMLVGRVAFLTRATTAPCFLLEPAHDRLAYSAIVSECLAKPILHKSEISWPMETPHFRILNPAGNGRNSAAQLALAQWPQPHAVAFLPGIMLEDLPFTHGRLYRRHLYAHAIAYRRQISYSIAQLFCISCVFVRDSRPYPWHLLICVLISSARSIPTSDSCHSHERF